MRCAEGLAPQERALPSIHRQKVGTITAQCSAETAFRMFKLCVAPAEADSATDAACGGFWSPPVAVAT